MRNGRDRRLGKPEMGHARKERVLLVGTRSADHIRASGHSGCIAMKVRPSSDNRPDTWLHPIVSLNRQILLAPRAPSIHGPNPKNNVTLAPGYWGAADSFLLRSSTFGFRHWTDRHRHGRLISQVTLLGSRASSPLAFPEAAPQRGYPGSSPLELKRAAHHSKPSARTTSPNKSRHVGLFFSINWIFQSRRQRFIARSRLAAVAASSCASK